MQTIIARPAIILFVNFTKIIQQSLSAALIRFRISNCLIKKLLPYLLFCKRFALHKFLQLKNILKTVESNALSLPDVTACTPRLLIITFQRLRHIIMDNKTDIGLINTHSKRYCRNNNIYVLHQKFILVCSSCCCIQAGMIRQCLDSVNAQQLSHFLHLFAAKAIYYSALAGIIFDKLYNLFLSIYFWTDFIIKVWSVE